MMPARLRQIVELILIGVHTAGSHFMQQRFPQMGAQAIDERDRGDTMLAKCVTKARCKLETAGNHRRRSLCDAETELRMSHC